MNRFIGLFFCGRLKGALGRAGTVTVGVPSGKRAARVAVRLAETGHPRVKVSSRQEFRSA